MGFNINKEKFADMEEAFKRLKASNSDISALRKLSDSLHSLTGKTLEVTTIQPQSKNQECNVMSVYPDESTIDAIINAIITEQTDAILAKLWNETMKWHMEIDTRILMNSANLTERELVALTLHEVGHVIESNSIPMRIARVLRFEFAKTSLVTKQLLKDNFFSRLLSFPILNACNMNRHDKSMRTEIKADRYAINSGYGKDLESAMDKIIIFAGSSTTEDDDMKDLMGFSIDSLLLLQKRQNNVVRRNMQRMITSTPSVFAKNIVSKFANTLNGNAAGNVSEAVKDDFIDTKILTIIDDFYAGEAFFNRVRKLKKIDPADIDYIYLEINDIRSNDDKMMIISYIYSKLEIIDYYLSIIDSKNPRYYVPHSRDELLMMKDRLLKYREVAINRKLPEIDYGISIQYPSGYEG